MSDMFGAYVPDNKDTTPLPQKPHDSSWGKRVLPSWSPHLRRLVALIVFMAALILATALASYHQGQRSMHTAAIRGTAFAGSAGCHKQQPQYLAHNLSPQ